MKKRFVKLVAAASIAAGTVGAVAVSDTAGAATPREGAACVRAGVKFLASNGLLVKAARQQVDYAPFDITGTGDIRTELGDSAFLPLGQVIRFHFTNPEWFSWCDRK
jgi:hypothetical protein